MTVDCSSPPDASYFSEKPRVIFEVLSKDTERIDRGEKLSNYQALASLSVYVLVDQYQMAVTAYRRTENGWTSELLLRNEDVLALSEIGCQLPLTAIYDRTGLAR